MTNGMLKKKSGKTKERVQNDANRPQPTSPISIISANAAGSTLTITFNGPVMLKGVPNYTTDVAGATPVTANLTGGNTLNILFSASIAAATTMTIPYEEPAIRNASGGFVSTSTFPC
jgi:hypothetical protein